MLSTFFARIHPSLNNDLCDQVLLLCWDQERHQNLHLRLHCLQHIVTHRNSHQTQVRSWQSRWLFWLTWAAKNVIYYNAAALKKLNKNLQQKAMLCKKKYWTQRGLGRKIEPFFLTYSPINVFGPFRLFLQSFALSDPCVFSSKKELTNVH